MFYLLLLSVVRVPLPLTSVSPFYDIACVCVQETLEDIDKNGDGHVDEDEYIGELGGVTGVDTASED